MAITAVWVTTTSSAAALAVLTCKFDKLSKLQKEEGRMRKKGEGLRKMRETHKKEQIYGRQKKEVGGGGRIRKKQTGRRFFCKSTLTVVIQQM